MLQGWWWWWWGGEATHKHTLFRKHTIFAGSAGSLQQHPVRLVNRRVVVVVGVREAGWGGRIRRVRRSSTLHHRQLLTGLCLLTNCQGWRSRSTCLRRLHCANVWQDETTITCVPNAPTARYAASCECKQSAGAWREHRSTETVGFSQQKLYIFALSLCLVPVICLHWLLDLLTGLSGLFFLTQIALTVMVLLGELPLPPLLVHSSSVSAWQRPRPS